MPRSVTFNKLPLSESALPRDYDHRARLRGFELEDELKFAHDNISATETFDLGLFQPFNSPWLKIVKNLRDLHRNMTKIVDEINTLPLTISFVIYSLLALVKAEYHCTDTREDPVHVIYIPKYNCHIDV
jgi:hypothetical protein